MIKRLIALLKSDTLRLEAEDIADALWLAGHWSQAEGPAMGAASQPEAPDAHGAARGGAAPSSSPLHSATSPGAVFAAPRGQSAQPLGASHRGRPLKTPLPPALRGRLRLGRALRPLKRTVNSAVSRVLDETASAERIASTGMMVPVLKPARERWLHVDVVFDDAASMDIWRPLILELQHLLEGSGIFRTVRTWRLAGGVQGPVCVYAGLEGRRLRGDQGRRPNEVGSAPGRQLIIVVSDCASSSWTNGDVAMVMRQWHQRSHVLVLQVLPQWLWERTALGAALPLRLAPDLSSPQRWRYTLPAEAIESRDGLRGIPIPLAGLDQASLLAWSQAFTGAQGRTVRGYLLEPDSPAYALQAELAAEQRALPAQERVERFRASASPLARRLAALLAAAPVITLPLIRMIQETLLPESTHTHCAEVLLSGLLRVVRPDVEAQEAGERLYDFVDDATRGLVLAPLPLSTSAAVFDSISRYVDQHSGHTTRNVIAALRDPDGSHELRLDEASRPFAVVSAALLRRLGGPYRGLAERLERELGAPQAPAPDQAAPPARPAASQAAEAASPQARWRRTPRVMVVEDDPATRRLYRFLLTSSGYEVTEAEDGIDAMEKHKRSPVDLIITDINMPRMGGVDLTMTLRQNQSDVYIIMVAAFSTPETEKRAFRAGVNEYLTKPFDFEELERRVQSFFSRQRT